MAFDSYALCPGGRDKKIRFCCPDMLKELEKVQTLLDGAQTSACLAYLDQLEPKHPHCACLTAARLVMLREERRYEEMLPIARAFVEREPENLLACGEFAIATLANGKLKEALDIALDGLERCEEGTLHQSLLNALYLIATQMLGRGMVVPAIAISHLVRIDPKMREAAQQLMLGALAIPEIPLIIRDVHFDHACPADFPAKTEFEAAVRWVHSGRWKKALTALEALSVHADRWPVLWKNIALLSLWLLDDEKAVGAFDKFCDYAADDRFFKGNIPGCGADDFGDIQFLRFCLTPDALGDQTEIVAREYELDRFDEAREILLSSPHFYRIDVGPQQFGGEGTPPPKDVFILLDRQFAPAGTEPTLENVSSQLATGLLFGRETDRPARLMVVEMLGGAQVIVDNLIRNAIGPMLGKVADPQPTRKISRTQAAVQYRFRFKPETMPTPEQLETLVVDYYENWFVDTFLNGPLGLFDGGSPRGVANDPACRAKLLGTVTMLDNWMNPEIAVAVGEKIRTVLQLPIPGPIAIPEGDLSDEEMSRFLDSVPTWRWYRFEVEKMPTGMLLKALRMGEIVQEPRCLIRFSEELLARPMNSMPPEARFLAFNTLIRVAQAEQNLEEALVWIERAKSECAELKVSPGIWKVAQISVYLGMGEMNQAQALIEEVATRHGNEPDTMQTLQELFVDLGLMRPDGTPAVPMRDPGAPRGTTATNPAPTSGLWTPEAETGGGASGVSKLWTPD